ncbi:MAG: family 1 glycosylhydrolase, partial [Bauldia sp.]
LLKANPSDFVGVNFYAPIFVGADDAYALGVRWNDTNPDAVKMFNGPVRPEAFYALLMRIRDEYGNPPVIVTENGAGFGDFDEVLEGGVVKDRLRTDYVRRHIAEMLQAKGDGADIRGYMTWSLFDNFEWIQGYTRRFGMVHVDYGTLKRTPKESFRAYRDIIARHS